MKKRKLLRREQFPLIIAISLFIIFLAGILVFKLSPLEKTVVLPEVTPTPIVLVPGKDYVAGQVLVKFHDNITEDAINQELLKNNARIIEQIKALHLSVLEVPVGGEKEVIANLTGSGIVEYAQYNFRYQRDWTPNDPNIDKQWHLKTIQAQEAWDITKGGGVKIAIVGDSVDLKHADLASQIVGVLTNDTSDQDHGTHLAGDIAAIADNSVGIAGVCPECKLLIGGGGGGDDASIIKGITWATDQGAKAISMSFHTSNNSQAMQQAIDYAWDKGAICFASTGNDGNQLTSPVYPAGNTHVVSVSSTDENDARSSFANYGSWVTITAPGSNIYTTQNGGSYTSASGTSESTPIAAAVAGLIWSTPYGTSAEAVVKHLCDTSDKIAGTGSDWQCGRINAYKAVQGTTNITPAPSIIMQPSINSPTPQATIITPPQASSPTPFPTPIGAVPTLYCLGSCPSATPVYIPPTSMPITEQPVMPTFVPDTITPDPTMIIPTLNPNPGTGSGNGVNQTILQQLLEFLQKLLSIFQQIIGGRGSNSE